MQKLMTSLVAAAMLAAPVCSSFAETSPRVEKAFQKADANGDGSVSLEELIGVRVDGLKTRTEKSGKEVTPEMLKGMKKRSSELFAEADANGDKKLSIEEFEATLPKPKEK